MITEFDSIFHENGFIFVNEMKQDIATQMAGRVDGQRNASRTGHYFGKGNTRQVRKGTTSWGIVDPGTKTGGADTHNRALNHDTGGSSGNISKLYLDDIEAYTQKRRAEKKEKEAKKKEQKSNEESALMESIELI